MSAPLTPTGAPPSPNAWHELEEVFASLGQLARSPVLPHEFYRQLLEECVRALAAAGGVVWLRNGGALQPVAQVRWPGVEIARDEAARRAHEELLADAAIHGAVTLADSRFKQPTGTAENPTEHALLLGPVVARPENGAAAPLAIVELLLEPNASPATYRGCEQFLTAVCELATDYHSFAELRRLRDDDAYRAELLRFSNEVHRQLRLRETAYAVANEGRRVIGCDRLSVVVARGRKSRLLATSGVSRTERRSGVVRRIEGLAELIRSTNEAAFYADGQYDALPPVAEALEEHAEESYARQIATIPLQPPRDPSETEQIAQDARQRQRRSEAPQFVLVAEQFDARHEELQRERLVDIADVCATALYNAQKVDRLPLGWLLRPLGEVKYWIGTHLPRTLLAIAAILAGVAALVYVPADFYIESPGTLQPVVRREVFAPRGGLVDEVLVSHGADVVAGQPLVRLRDPTLDLELKRVDGEMETTQRQLDAVRTTRTNRQIRDARPTDGYRLSAEERELQQRLANLRQERELLDHEREALVVASPIAGRVLSWDLGQRLAARPVERGEVLVTVADLNAEWQLELAVPDDRIGYVLAAQQELQPGLAVRFRLSSDDRETHAGHILEVARTADVATAEGAAATPTVLVKVALEELQFLSAAARELRPGVSARAQIDCGRRPLGYVWLHDIWDAAVQWLQF